MQLGRVPRQQREKTELQAQWTLQGATLKELHSPAQGWPRSGLPWVRFPRETRTLKGFHGAGGEQVIRILRQ
jgi:hypothetical protein